VLQSFDADLLFACTCKRLSWCELVCPKMRMLAHLRTNLCACQVVLWVANWQCTAIRHWSFLLLRAASAHAMPSCSFWSLHSPVVPNCYCTHEPLQGSVWGSGGSAGVQICSSGAQMNLMSTSYLPQLMIHIFTFFAFSLRTIEMYEKDRMHPWPYNKCVPIGRVRPTCFCFCRATASD